MKAIFLGVIASFLAVTSALAQDGAHAVPQVIAMTPAEAIEAAAAKPEAGAAGTFVFVVKSVGDAKSPQGVIVYLNSETDYRSNANISAMVMPLSAKSLVAKLGGPLRETLIGKQIAVTGVARQTRIDFYDDKAKTGEYYFQTRISVRDADQVRVTRG